jgi:hypothetical protein
MVYGLISLKKHDGGTKMSVLFGDLCTFGRVGTYLIVNLFLIIFYKREIRNKRGTEVPLLVLL